MNKNIKELIVKAKSNDSDKISDALTDLGLLIERHTQNRYSEEDYLILLGNNIELFELRLEEEEVDIIVNFFFFHILNININPITVAWCLGKCYNVDILEGMKRLLVLFSYNDELTLQLLFSINGLFGFEKIKEELIILNNTEGLTNTKKYLNEIGLE